MALTNANDNELPDGPLVLRAQAGERAAFDCLARRYRGMLRAAAFIRTGDNEAAEDLTQEVLARAWAQLPALRAVEAFSGWLQVIMRNACRNWYRQRPGCPLSLEELSAGTPLRDRTPGPLETLLAREHRQRWRRALLALPDENRLALVMHVWGKQSYEEIARQLAVPLPTVQGRIYRAKAQLRRLLDNEAALLLDEPPCRRQQKEE